MVEGWVGSDGKGGVGFDGGGGVGSSGWGRPRGKLAAAGRVVGDCWAAGGGGGVGAGGG